MLDSLVPLLLLFTVLWLVSLPLANSSIVDIWWGPAFLVATAAYLGYHLPVHPRAWLVSSCVLVWALRLAWHIGRRNVGHGEDRRYAAWRAQHGAAWWWRSYGKVFLLQGIVAWIVSWPLLYAVRSGGPFPTSWDIAGTLIFASGLLFESLADRQLELFKRDPASAGRVMDRGLWRYSRHPNYFGEAVLWWGLGIIGAGTPRGWVGLIGPLLITWLLLRVSGVTMLERGLLQTKPGYKDYVARTSSFVPRRPLDP